MGGDEDARRAAKQKEEADARAIEMKRLQASILEADTQEYMQMEKQKSTDRRVRNVEHRIELEAQIADRAAVIHRKYAMSGAEVKMNRQLLDLVNKTLTERDAYVDTHDPDAELQ